MFIFNEQLFRNNTREWKNLVTFSLENGLLNVCLLSYWIAYLNQVSGLIGMPIILHHIILIPRDHLLVYDDKNEASPSTQRVFDAGISLLVFILDSGDVRGFEINSFDDKERNNQHAR